MAKIERKNLKIFAENAANTGQFGSAQNGTKITSKDPETIQALDAWGAGWSNAIIGGSRLPPLEELQATTYVPTYHLAYLYQEGLAEWDIQTTYYLNSFVKHEDEFFVSLVEDNVGHAVTETTYWKQFRFGETWTVGDVKESMLDPTSFIALNGDSWVPLDGTDVTGSMYETITGNATVPDASGAFIRSVGGAADSVGVLQSDATAQNGLTVAWGSANVTTNTSTVSWSSANASTSSTSHYHRIFDNNQNGSVNNPRTNTNGSEYMDKCVASSGTQPNAGKTNTTGGGLTVNKNQWNSNQTAHSHTFNKNVLNTGQSWTGDAETRPVNIALYYYIKVN